jgi:hypothetical protein
MLSALLIMGDPKNRPDLGEGLSIKMSPNNFRAVRTRRTRRKREKYKGRLFKVWICGDIQ